VRTILFYSFLFLCTSSIIGQEQKNLEYFINQAKEHLPSVKEIENLKRIGELQYEVIKAQNNAFQVNATTDVLVAPYFNNDGKFIDITTNPSNNAYGYDVGITNGGLYSAQVNITKSLFNKKLLDGLLLQSKLTNEGVLLSSEAIVHTLIKNITDTYILAYQQQLKIEFADEILAVLRQRLDVVAVLVKNGILSSSDYLLLKLDLDTKNIELQQYSTAFNTTIIQLYSLCGITAEKTESLLPPILDYKENPKTFFYLKKYRNDSLQLKSDEQVLLNRYKPNLSFYGNTGVNAVELSHINHKIGASVGLHLDIPIYDGNRRKYMLDQYKLKKENLERYKKNDAVKLNNDLKALHNQVDALQNQMILLNKQLDQYAHIQEIYKEKFVQGQVSIVDYLNVIQNYKSNMYTKLQAQTNLWLLKSQFNYTNW